MWKSGERSDFTAFEFTTIISIEIYTLTFISAQTLLWSRKTFFCKQDSLSCDSLAAVNVSCVETHCPQLALDVVGNYSTIDCRFC